MLTSINRQLCRFPRTLSVGSHELGNTVAAFVLLLETDFGEVFLYVARGKQLRTRTTLKLSWVAFKFALQRAPSRPHAKSTLVLVLRNYLTPSFGR